MPFVERVSNSHRYLRCSMSKMCASEGYINTSLYIFKQPPDQLRTTTIVEPAGGHFRVTDLDKPGRNEVRNGAHDAERGSRVCFAAHRRRGSLAAPSRGQFAPLGPLLGSIRRDDAMPRGDTVAALHLHTCNAQPHTHLHTYSTGCAELFASSLSRLVNFLTNYSI